MGIRLSHWRWEDLQKQWLCVTPPWPRPELPLCGWCQNPRWRLLSKFANVALNQADSLRCPLEELGPRALLLMDCEISVGSCGSYFKEGNTLWGRWDMGENYLRRTKLLVLINHLFFTWTTKWVCNPCRKMFKIQKPPTHLWLLIFISFYSSLEGNAQLTSHHGVVSSLLFT